MTEQEWQKTADKYGISVEQLKEDLSPGFPDRSMYKSRFYYKSYKCHRDRDVVILDEDVTVDSFLKDNRFDCTYCWDINTNLVLAYTETFSIYKLYIRTLFGNLDNVDFAMHYADFGEPEVYFNNATFDMRWMLGCYYNNKLFSMKIDSGASTTVFNINDCSRILGSNSYIETLHIIDKIKHGVASPMTANGKVIYYSIPVNFSFDRNSDPVKITIYVDPKNKLQFPLLGLDIISSCHIIVTPGEPPVFLDFKYDKYIEYLKKHRLEDNNTIDLLEILSIEN